MNICLFLKESQAIIVKFELKKIFKNFIYHEIP